MGKEKILLIFILLFALISRIWRLDVPDIYYFDEVYHAFTAQAYAQNDPRGYEWWNEASEGFAYEWLHPPLAKLIQALSINVLDDTPFAWRFPGVLFGTATVFLLYLFGKNVFKSVKIGLLASLFWAFDGLSFTVSRITMNDIYFTFFAFFSFYLFLTKRKPWIVGTALGLALATKWSGVFVLGTIAFLWILQELHKDLNTKRIRVFALSFIAIPLIVYMVSFSQFFLQGHTWRQFLELHRQTWWYQTNLDAAHPYSSSALSWPIMLRPVFAFTEIDGGKVSNIYLMGNPILWWGGLFAIFTGLWAVVLSVYQKRRLKKQESGLLVLLIAYFSVFLPWAFSPRIMFIYHYLPALPFLFLILAWALDKLWERKKLLVAGYLLLVVLAFIFFYPHWSALPVPQEFDQLYYITLSWR